MRIREAASLYLAEKGGRLRESTVEGYASALRLHVVPRWGDAEIADIDPADVQEWIDGFERPGAALKAWKTLRQVVRWAIRRLRLRVWDPTSAGVELPRIERAEPRTLSAPEAARYLRGLWGCPHEAAAVFALALGLRPCEVRGLKWSDVDFRTGEVRVRRSRTAAFGEWHVHAPKTPKSRRTLVLPQFALKRLRQLRGGRAGWVVGEGDLGRLGRALKSWCARRGLPWVPLQNLRHTWATLALEAGVPIEVASMCLGHSEVGTAYAHYMRRTGRVCREAQRAWAAHVEAAAG